MGNVIEPSNDNKIMKFYEYFMNNSRWVNGTIDYMLLEVRMFWSYESTFDSNSDNDSLSSYFFSWNFTLPMATNSKKRSGVEDFETHYTCNQIVAFFKRH